MNDLNLAYALMELASYSRQHGIYELRQAYLTAAQLAGDASTNEDLAKDLEKMSLSCAKGPAPVASEPSEPSEPVETNTKEPVKSKPKR